MPLYKATMRIVSNNRLINQRLSFTKLMSIRDRKGNANVDPLTILHICALENRPDPLSLGIVYIAKLVLKGSKYSARIRRGTGTCADPCGGSSGGVSCCVKCGIQRPCRLVTYRIPKALSVGSSRSPVVFKPLAFWNQRRASRVCGPRVPSSVPGL
jgi:hypothetical protein